MPTEQEKNTFRRLIGDYTAKAVSDQEILNYLNDATFEVTTDFVAITTTTPVLSSPVFNQFEHFTEVKPVPVKVFDELYIQFHPEVIYKAAINFWWSKASELAGRLTSTVGQASQNVSELYQNAMAMIASLEEHYKGIQQLGLDITVGNFSYFNKRTMERVGGQREEDSLMQGEGAQPGNLWYG